MNQFTHIGMNNVVNNAKILFITKPGTTSANRYLEVAKKTGRYHNAALGRHHRSLLIMDDGTVIVSCIKPRTLMDRLNSVPTPDDDEIENEIEDDDDDDEDEKDEDDE